MEKIKIVCPTYKRPDRVLTKKIIKNLILCVTQSEYDIYHQNNPDVEIVVHPDNIKGLPAKKQWMYEYFGNMFSIDDDCVRCSRIYADESIGEQKIRDAKLIEDIIQSTYHLALEIGVYLFGFSKSANAVSYECSNPLKLSGYINGSACGYIKSPNLYWNTDLKTGEDFWMSGINAYYNRMVLIDNRFSFEMKDVFKNPGGLSEVRNLDVEKETYFKLKKYFGNCIIKKNPTNTSKIFNPWERTFKVPF